MTLDEAIKHAEERAEDLRKEGIIKQNRNNTDESVLADRCIKCAEEYRQLAEWLKDYKRLLEQQPCEDCISREAVEDAIAETIVNGESLGHGVAYDILSGLPSVTSVFVLKTIKEKKNEINNFMESQSLSQHL